MRKRIAIILLALMLGACNLDVPEVTPTVAPTLTPTQSTPSAVAPTPTTSPVATNTDTPLPSPTPTFTLTPTPIPTATFTPTPSLIPTDTYTPTFTPSPTPTITLTPSTTPTGTLPPTDTFTPTFTPSDTSTYTPTFTPTPSATTTPSATFTLTPLPSDTQTSTFTPLPSDTLTPSPTPTFTPTLTFTPSNTPTETQPPSPTPLPIIPSSTPTGTFTATLIPTTAPTRFIPPSLTSPPLPSPLPLPGTALFFSSPTPVPPVLFVPTLDTTPVFITVEAPATSAQVTPIFSTIAPIGERETPNVTPLILPTDQPTTPTAIPPIAIIPLDVPQNPLTRAFALSTSGGVVSGSGFLLPYGGGAVRFARNPANPNQYAMTDPRGVLYMVDNFLSGGTPIRPEFSPFSRFEPDTAAHNNALVTQVAYSPNGQYLAFLVNTESEPSTENDSTNDGVWVVATGGGGAGQVFRECPPIVSVCTVDRANGPYVYDSIDMAWSYQSDALLITVNLPEEGRRAYVIVAANQDANYLPQTWRYDTAHWAFDGRLAVGGRGLDGQPMIGIVRRDGTPDFIRRASEIGLAWTQDAVLRADGRIVMLGSTTGAGSPQQLFDQDGNALTGLIGDAPPERVSWSSDRSAALVITARQTDTGIVRRFFVAEVSGLVREITAQVAGSLAVEWVSDAVPPGVDVGQPASETPSPPSRVGVQIGAHLQIIAPVGANFRTEPSAFAPNPILLDYGANVTIIDGPIPAEGLLWWKIQTDTGAQGWIAESDGYTQILGMIISP